MIQDLDESLRALVRRDALNGSGVEVSFDAPTKEWSARRNTPTVDLYLYDIREDLVRREVTWEPVRDKTGRVTDRRPPARRFKFSYLVTAWTQRAEDEHRLLSTLLTCFLANETLPPDLLEGALAGIDVPVLMTIALPPPADRSLSDVWTALGGELKPSLDLVVTAPVIDVRAESAGPPVLEEPRIRVGGETVRSRGPRSAVGAPEPINPPDEKVVSGAAAQPGRVIRLRGSARR
jgi:Pvc16 N-terminal domain